MTQRSKGMPSKSMRLIKRYPNRKLYDTIEKKYVTLNDVARIIREGQEVQVTDYASNEDLTAVTLTQIIFEQEKRQAGFLPRAVLRGLVQAGGDRISTLRRALALPLGLVQQVDEEIDRRLRSLVRRGALEEAECLRLHDLLLEGDVVENDKLEINEDDLRRALTHIGVPSRSIIQELARQVEQLTTDIDTFLRQNKLG